jgi:hypothetical protein
LNKIPVLRAKENIRESTDETTHESGRKVVNVVIAGLKNDKMLSAKLFVLLCQELSAVHRTTMARVFNEDVHILWPVSVKFAEVFFLVTDVAQCV